MSDPNSPGGSGKRPTLTLKGRPLKGLALQEKGGKAAAQAQEQAPVSAPPTPPPAPVPSTASPPSSSAEGATAQKPPAPFMQECFMVMRDRGLRPKARHGTLSAAQAEAQRIAASCPGQSVWIMRCEVIETVCVEAPPADQAPSGHEAGHEIVQETVPQSASAAPAGEPQSR